MVYVIASVEIAPGRGQDARDWFAKFNAYVNKSYGLQGQVLMPVVAAPGESRRILSLMPYDSLTAYAAHQEKVLQDPQRNTLVREAFEERQYLLANTFGRAVYTVI
jgi:hypothetical protein